MGEQRKVLAISGEFLPGIKAGFLIHHSQ